MSMQLHHTLMSQYKHGTASGIGSVSYESVANCVTPEIVIYGKCVQNGTPTPDAPVDIVANNNTYKCHGKNLIPFPYATSVGTHVNSGVTFTVNADGSITIKGTAINWGANIVLLNNASLGATNIDARNVAEGNTNGEYVLSKHLYYNATNKVITVNVIEGHYIDETIYPQAEKGCFLSTYSPYFDGGTITAPDLYAITSSYGFTYRDEYYPQTGKIIRNCGVITIDETADIKSNTWLDGQNGVTINGILSNCNGYIQSTHESLFSMPSSLGDNSAMIYTSNKLYWYGILDVLGMTTVDEFKAWLAEQKEAGTPVKVVYKLKESVIEYVEATPLLSKRSVDKKEDFKPILNAVGDVKDEYNPITGEYIRRCRTIRIKIGWQYGTADNAGFTYCFNVDDTLLGYQKSICSHFENVNGTWLVDCKGQYGIYSDHLTANIKYFRPPNENITTVNEFNAWLTEQDKAGTPVILTYILAEPISGVINGDVTVIEETADSAVTDTQIDVKYLTHS